jgi:acetolactate synthase-1/2/3 large subunit
MPTATKASAVASPAASLRVAATPTVAAPAATTTVATELVAMLSRLGAREAFGVSGGAMAAFWDALSASPLVTYHFRHENGAAFAAIESSLAANRPTVLFTTTGPGLTNALTGIVAAREERARVIVVSAYTSAATRGRFAIQETSRDTLPPSLFESGRLFHHAAVVEDPSQLAGLEEALAAGVVRRDGFVAHVALATAVQRAPVMQMATPSVTSPARPDETRTREAAPPNQIRACIDALRDGAFAIWVGYGARDASAEVAALARRLQAPVMCSPRGKGIFPEDDPLFVGVTGLAGHASVSRFLEERAPQRLLVLGSRLGESTSFWDPRFVRPGGFVHVDVDPDVPGRAFPTAPTLAIAGDVGATLRAVLAELGPGAAGGGATGRALPPLPHPQIERLQPRAEGLVRPEALMDVLQDRVVDGSDATLLAESGNSFLWTTHRLRFRHPRRYRISDNVGAMGHAAAGVVGVALATGRRAVAVVGDGALLMTNEINTAVKFGARAVWIVLNDGRYGMCAQGMQTLGLTADAAFPQVDFVAFARAQGACARRVDHETELDAALAEAMACDGPFVVDVHIDPCCAAPATQRNQALAAARPDAERIFPSAAGD